MICIVHLIKWSTKDVDDVFKTNKKRVLETPSCRNALYVWRHSSARPIKNRLNIDNLI